MSALHYMVSIDGATTPNKIHDTVSAARDEAERLSNMPEHMNSVIRVLMVVCTLRSTATFTKTSYWEEGGA
jgi:hypothetical protein